MQAADPDLRVAVRFRPEKSGYLTYHGVEAPPQIPADHGARQWLYMIGDAARQGRASSTMWRDEHGRVSGAASAAVPLPVCCPPSLRRSHHIGMRLVCALCVLRSALPSNLCELPAAIT